jgi:hypothetical protein
MPNGKIRANEVVDIQPKSALKKTKKWAKKKSEFFIMLKPNSALKKTRKWAQKNQMSPKIGPKFKKSPKNLNFSKGGYSGAVLSFITANRRL